MTHPSQRALEELRSQHEATMSQVKAKLPAVFGIDIEDVPNAEWDHKQGFMYGTLVSGGKTYKWKLGQGRKSLVPVPEES